MPVSPQEIATARISASVNKVCDVIDRKLNDHETTFPYLFKFLTNTPYAVVTTVEDVYTKLGWQTRLWGPLDTDGVPQYSLEMCPPQGVWPLPDPTKPCPKLTDLTDPIGPADPQPSNSVAKAKEKVIDHRAEKKEMVDLAMQCEDGRRCLTLATLEPVNTALTYQSMLRKMLVTYAKGTVAPPVASPSAVYWEDELGKRQASFKAELRVRRTGDNIHDVDELTKVITKAVNAWEDRGLLNLLKHAHSPKQTIQTYGETVKRAVEDSVGELEMDDNYATRIMLNHRLIRSLRSRNFLTHEDYDEACQRDIIMTGLYGHWAACDVHCLTCIPDNTIYLSSLAQRLGHVKIEKFDIANLCESEDGKYLCVDVEVILEAVIYNPEGIRRVQVRL